MRTLKQSLKSLFTPLVSLALLLAPLAGCESLPGNKKTQGAVIGGAGGALAGAAIGGEKNRLTGALLGGLLGAGGGYLIGSQVDKNHPDHRDEAMAASSRAESAPASPADVARSSTADLNNDGFVTLDEVVAMKNANLPDTDIINRLRATNQVFALTTSQEQYLRDRGVPESVISAMRSMNRPTTPQPLPPYSTPQGQQPIGQPAPNPANLPE